MIRVGLVGAGFIGRNHFNQYEKLGKRARIVAICDADPARARGDWSGIGGNLADKTGRVQDLGEIRPYERWQDIVADAEVDMLDVTVPTFLHAEITIAALQAGKHVLCEKPMALTTKDCDRMIAAARKARRLLMVAQVIRFWPEYVWLRQAYGDKRYGKLRSLSLRRQAFTPDWSYQSWMLDPKKSGGAVLDLHVHDADYALWLLGKPKSVYAQGYQSKGKPGRVQALWDYGKDRAVYLEGGEDYPNGFGFNMGFTAMFEKAAVVWDMVTGRPLTVFPVGGGSETPQLPQTDGYLAEIEYFLSCIENGRKPTECTPQESRDAVAVALAELKSLQTGKPVAIL